jgi:ABC-type multidrug transport system fused ATPase/permease subunit
MIYRTASEWRQSPRKRVLLFGMSGLGKTTISNLLRAERWFHYSIDYRIGTRYMGEHIADMFKPTKKIIKEWNTFGKIYASVERIGDLMDRKPAVEDAPNATLAPRFQGKVAFEHVSFAYMSDPEDEKGGVAPELKLALRDISFTIAPSEVVALVGGSGAGKSTIVQLLPRLYDPHAGAITIDGQDIRSFTLDSLRGQMSMVLQEAILFTGTVAENIAYGRPGATHEEIIAAAMQATLCGEVRLDLRAGAATDTPARRDAAARAARQAQAERVIREDPAVIELLGQFKGARIVPNSIKPLSPTPSPEGSPP